MRLVIDLKPIPVECIFYGGTNLNNVPDIILTGEGTFNGFGLSVSGAGDVNGDGYADVIIGARGIYNNYPGRAYIYFGGSSMNNSADIILTGEAPGSEFGNSVSDAGDVNGDGYDDVVVGTYDYGRAYIFFGGSSMNNIADVTFTGVPSLGFSVSSAGDVNGDGYSDVIVGANRYQFNIGRAYIYYGNVLMNNVADVILIGEAGSAFGISVSSAGDVNGDGFSDVIVGANIYNGSNGRAEVFYGANDMDSIPDVTMVGSPDDYFGGSVSGVGDVNGDGYSDVIVGAAGYSNNKGRAFIFYGGLNMNNTSDEIIIGEALNNFFGGSVSNAGDVNGAGYPDIIIGASGYNTSTGRAYIYMRGPSIKINLKILFEGMYFPLFNQMTRRDTVTAYLHQSIPPYNKIDSAKTVIDSISFSRLFQFNNASSGTYYVVAKHFNTIETWSKTGGESLIADGSIYNYDFTTSASQAYGNNQKLKGGKYCIYSGDVNQDGLIDLSDFSDIDNHVYSFASGRFVVTDLNGDTFVDQTDMTIADNNRLYIGVIRP